MEIEEARDRAAGPRARVSRKLSATTRAETRTLEQARASSAVALAKKTINKKHSTPRATTGNAVRDIRVMKLNSGSLSPCVCRRTKHSEQSKSLEPCGSVETILGPVPEDLCLQFLQARSNEVRLQASAGSPVS